MMAPRVQRKPAKKSAAQQVQQVAKQMAPKSRTPYAIYLQDSYTAIAEDIKAQGFTKTQVQREVISRVASNWKAMSQSEKAVWEQRSKDEAAARQEAIQQFQTIGRTCSDAQKAELPHPRIGCFELEGTVAWEARESKAVHAHDRQLLTAAQAIIFQDRVAFRRELEILRKLSREQGQNTSFCEQLYLYPLQTTSPESAAMTVVYEFVPRLDMIMQRDGPISGRDLEAIARQVAKGLLQLHEIGVLHGDIRPATVFYSRQERCAKLARYAFSVDVVQREDLPVVPYSPAYRAPELWRSLSGLRLNGHSESWAFGAFLAECAAGKAVFTEVPQILDFKDNTVPPVIAQLKENIQFVCLQFLQKQPSRRMCFRDFLSGPLPVSLNA